ncbi:hypothetical protein Rhal01_03195 [Rubritalea halochordaticola]|uniref:Peptidase S54 rhomboid domain-containing protein n=1 Tax=Rubritalea halochordaticola TaxID=714537 RepID=A0ABP9V2W2_9BACT
MANHLQTSYRPVPKLSPMILLELVLAAWIIEAIDQLLLGGFLDQFGVRPRSLMGLIGIPLMPFLHGNFSHLLSNTLPFLVLGYIMLKAEGRRFLYSSVYLIFLSGLGTWLISPANSVHIGASGLIYGYFGYILTRAWLDRHPLWMLTGIIVIIFYGGMIYGVLPNQSLQVSWQGHLCGLIAGIALGRRHRHFRPE